MRIRPVRIALVAASLVLAGAWSQAASASTTASATPAANSADGFQPASSLPAGTVAPVCPGAGTVSSWTCRMLQVGTGGRAITPRSPQGYSPRTPPCDIGPSPCYSPQNLWDAYKLGNPLSLGGSLIVLVEAYDYPTMVSDINVYRGQFGLGGCTSLNDGSGCTFTNGASIRKVNVNGTTSPMPATNGGFASETALDVDMASAVCPLCPIIVVEAKTSAEQDVLNAMDRAASYHPAQISLSLGRDNELSGDVGEDQAHFEHAGTAIAVAAGDCDYGAGFPAASPGVISVGGTSLTTAQNQRGWTETVWGGTQANSQCASGVQGTASGCSKYQPKPSWQTDPGCSRRTMNDIAAVADPQTGVAVYSTTGQNGWIAAGGTSAAAPIIAGIYGLAGGDQFGSGARGLYRTPTTYNDVTTGTNGTCGNYLCQAQAGYDGPTGLGTPNGLFSKAPPPPQGYWLVASDGGIFPFGNAVDHSYGSTGGIHLNQPIVGMERTLSGNGYWLVASDGGIFPFGDAGGYGSTGNIRLNRPIVGMARTVTGAGYWLVASDGGIFPFGDAVGYGSTGNIHLNQPIVGMARTQSGNGYWLVASDGGIFPFGDAIYHSYGSTGGIHLNKPIVGMAASGDGNGYWLVASDGGIFPFGDAAGYGSTGGMTLNKPIVGMAASPDGGGYWLVASDGGIFPFGDAMGLGSTGGMTLNKPVVGMAASKATCGC